MRKKFDKVIGGQRFSRRSDAADRARQILADTAVGERVAAEYEPFVLDLLSLHPRCDEKTGAGLSFVRVNESRVWKRQKFFEVVRTDGTTTDFSFHVCLDNSLDTRDYYAACRSAVLVDILSFKKSVFGNKSHVCCAISGRPVVWGDCHIDHAPPNTFKAIADDFAASMRIDKSLVLFRGKGDNEHRVEFFDGNLSASFKLFHAERCSLRIVGVKENLSHSKIEGNHLCRTTTRQS